MMPSSFDHTLDCLYATDPLSSLPGPVTGDLLRARYREHLGAGLALVMVSSVDGSSSLRGLSGGLSSDADQWHMDVARSAVDAVVVAAGTLRDEGYGGLRVSDTSVAWRTGHGLPEHPRLVVVSGSGGIDPGHAVFSDAPVRPLLVTSAGADDARVAALSEVADVVRASPADAFHSVDPRGLVAALYERGLTRATTEGGPSWTGAAAASGVLSDVLLTTSPALVGGNAPRIVGTHAGEVPVESAGLGLVQLLRHESMLISWYRRT